MTGTYPTYEDAVTIARAHFETTNQNTCVYAILGGWGWCTFVEYALDTNIHPFQLAWSSDAEPSFNKVCLECALSWQHANA